MRRNKYGAVKVHEDGITFDSKAEHKHYRDLKIRLKKGEIADLQVHGPKLALAINGIKLGHYVPDFTYYDRTLERTITADVKGMPTPVYRLKAKLVKAIHGIEILVVPA